MDHDRRLWIGSLKHMKVPDPVTVVPLATMFGNWNAVGEYSAYEMFRPGTKDRCSERAVFVGVRPEQDLSLYLQVLRSDMEIFWFEEIGPAIMMAAKGSCPLLVIDTDGVPARMRTALSLLHEVTGKPDRPTIVLK
jgi:hypothetical protein